MLDIYTCTYKYMKMPNKTIYVRDADLALWGLAQAELGESMSALFAKFLREKLPKMDAFVHVLHSSPGNDEDFAVMFSPIKATTSASVMKPHFVNGSQELVRFLQDVGLTPDACQKIEADLKTLPSVSLRTTLSRDAANTNFYRLRFNPIMVPDNSGSERLLKVDAIAIPTSRGGKYWRAEFHVLDDLLLRLENVLCVPAAQLNATRRLLVSGRLNELGGSSSGVLRVVREDELLELGLVETSDLL